MAAPFKPGQLWPDLALCNRDPVKLMMHGLAAIVRIAAQDQDRKHALEAGKWLVGYGEELLRQKRSEPLEKSQKRNPELANRSEILAELKGLYAKALGPAPPLVVTAEPADEPVPAPVSNHDR